MASPNAWRAYENIDARDNARMHNGDVYNNYNSIDASRSYFASLPAPEREILLLKSAVEGQTRRVTLLLQAGTNPDARDRTWECTPLMLAAEGGHELCVQILLDYGADTNALDKMWCSALEHAAREERSGVVKLLMAERASTTYILHTAVVEYTPKALSLLLEHGLDVNAKNSEGETPLIRCVLSESPISIARLLLEAGADVDAQDGNGDTALMHACRTTAPEEFVRLLIGRNAKLDTQNLDGRTALMTACWYKGYVHAMLLLQAGAAASLESKVGGTALTSLHEKNDIAAGPSHASVHEALVAAGADLGQVKGRELHLL